MEAIEEAQANKAAFVVYSLSRLSRSTRDTLTFTEALDKAGADLVSLSEKIDTTSAAGKMLFRMLAVLSEFERDQIAERTKAALGHMKAQGKKTGGFVPFGSNVDDQGRLNPDQAEQAVINRILELREQGKSFSAIARDLNALGFKTKTGKTWYPQTVKNVLQRAA